MLDVERLHLGVGYFHPGGVVAGWNSACTTRPVDGAVPRMRPRSVSEVRHGTPAQLRPGRHIRSDRFPRSTSEPEPGRSSHTCAAASTGQKCRFNACCCSEAAWTARSSSDSSRLRSCRVSILEPRPALRSLPWGSPLFARVLSSSREAGQVLDRRGVHVGDRAAEHQVTCVARAQNGASGGVDTGGE
jgi:hypothetical protein